MSFPKVIDDVTLDYLKLEDAPDLFALVQQNRAYLRQWLPWLDQSTTLEDTFSFIKDCINGYANNTSLVLAIWHDNALIGTIAFHQFDWENKQTSMGYWISKPYQGKGLVTKACQALIDYAIYELKVEKITISCATENDKSQAIPLRLGFYQQGVIPQKEWLYNHYVDHIVYAMDADTWKSALHLHFTAPSSKR